MIVLIIGLLFAGATGNVPSTAATIAELNRRRGEFDGKEVVVRGYLWVGPEQLYVIDKPFNTDDAFDKASGCLSLLNVGHIETKAAWTGKYVEIKGRFVEKNESYGVSLMTCGWTGLDLHADPDAAIKLQEKRLQDDRLPVEGYFGKGEEPSFAEKYPKAPALPTARATFEKFARSVGLNVAKDLPEPATCINQTTIRPPGPTPAACAYVGKLNDHGRAREAYVVFYDGRSMAYAVVTQYEYTGL
jgi:hypothetical protein